MGNGMAKEKEIIRQFLGQKSQGLRDGDLECHSVEKSRL